MVAFEITEDDLNVVLDAHDTKLSKEEFDQCFDGLDIGFLESCALSETDLDDQTNAMFSYLEDELISNGWVTEPKRFFIKS